jgi:hypothetical protein
VTAVFDNGRRETADQYVALIDHNLGPDRTGLVGGVVAVTPAVKTTDDPRRCCRTI